MQKHNTALVAFGGNLASRSGEPAATVSAAIAAVAQRLGTLESGSGLYRTPAFPEGAGPDFVNAVAGFRTPLDAAAVLDALHTIEETFDRQRTTRWAARTLDLDLLAWNDAVLPDADIFAQWRDLPLAQQMAARPDTLILPHPRLQDRAFVLVPLAQVAPDWVHPVLRRTVRQMLAALPRAEVDAVQRLG
ncbi:2-amino-4-hydroxy-6-hydroxymethyldihydropteridine diphosphokinase [Roseicitreum antarcticum]|uniref:2-amino-4-hydroxy-6-hydroxymethyldihydropteridine pyrophosphokinase n=1 Tax=Roseicitreum antarcticum TaxID=564137 RepID=A0A1H3APY6_9RHOB|nr:2-amino-4-hydroxy-6-hydroxymethyldihydropteridine diphosphokinase [Roseicitreum antarcticum]SDX31772.1 2-amino-4-hydroxy-6-hydroxymethyldihydropteridinediphosphokinase [Roseicitreum antarcticum]